MTPFCNIKPETLSYYPNKGYQIITQTKTIKLLPIQRLSNYYPYKGYQIITHTKTIKLLPIQRLSNYYPYCTFFKTLYNNNISLLLVTRYLFQKEGKTLLQNQEGTTEVQSSFSPQKPSYFFRLPDKFDDFSPPSLVKFC